MLHKIARTIVIKAGGNAMDPAGEAEIAAEVGALTKSGHTVVLVHGGGPEIDAELARLAIPSARIDGLRATSARALEATERVLCGTVNKRLVRALLREKVHAVGISGIDGPLLEARPIDFARLGYVGEIASVNAAPLVSLLDAGYVPVVAPLAFDPVHQTALNVNADTSAAAIAVGLGAAEFLLLTNVARVRRRVADPASGIDAMHLSDARSFAASPSCEGSMRPKVQAAIDAVAAGVARARIGAAPITRMLEGEATVVFA